MVEVPGNKEARAHFRRIKMMEFEQLAANYSKMIYSMIHSLGIYKNQDEFYQIGLISLWEASQHYDEQKGAFPAYLRKSIRGKLLNTLRDDEVWNQQNVCSETCDHRGYSDRTFEKEMLLDHFYHLTEKQTKWVVMRYYYGLSKRDIAEMENIPVRKVRSWGDLAMKKCLLKQEV